MASLKYAAIRAAFEALSLSGLSGAIRAGSRSKGVIFTLHRVLPDAPAEFAPNAILQVTPAFLDYTIKRVRKLGLDIVTLDEAVRRIASDEPARKFIVFSFDDAYRDNLAFALPILRANNCPFTLYVPTALVDGVGEVWWQALEEIIARQAVVDVPVSGDTLHFDTATLAEKQAAYDTIYWRMRTMPEAERVMLIRALAERHGFDLDRHCRSLIMDWTELKTFANEPLCTIGAHTVHHFELAKLTPKKARTEIEQSRQIIEAKFGVRPQHLSYPVGGFASAGPREYALAKELGFQSGVTTLPGGVYPGDREKLHALPRVSLNGLFQQRRFVDVFATGAIFSTLGKLTG